MLVERFPPAHFVLLIVDSGRDHSCSLQGSYYPCNVLYGVLCPAASVQLQHVLSNKHRSIVLRNLSVGLI